MKHFTLPRFWQHDHLLPEDVQKLADKNYDLGGASETRRILWIALAISCVLLGRQATGKGISFGNPEDRPDRLVTITGPYRSDLVAQ